MGYTITGITHLGLSAYSLAGGYLVQVNLQLGLPGYCLTNITLSLSVWQSSVLQYAIN